MLNSKNAKELELINHKSTLVTCNQFQVSLSLMFFCFCDIIAVLGLFGFGCLYLSTKTVLPQSSVRREALGKRQGAVLVYLSWATGWERARLRLHSAAGCVGQGMCVDNGEPALSGMSTGCRVQQSHILWTSCWSHNASHLHPHCTSGKHFQENIIITIILAVMVVVILMILSCICE